MTDRPRISRPVLTAIFVICCVAAALYTRMSYVYKGFFADDFSFVQLGVFTIPKVLKALNPVTITWFYRPVYIIWVMLFNSLFPTSSVALHTAGIILYGLTIALAGILVYRLTSSRFAALATSLLFLFSIGMDEAISWIASHSTLLASLFSLITLHLWLSWRNGGRRFLMPIALLTMAIALCSKEDAATLPLILIAFDWYLVGRQGSRPRLRELAPAWTVLLGIMAIYGMLDVIAYHYVNLATHYGTTHLWHGMGLSKWNLTATFGLRTVFFHQFGSTLDSSLNPIIILFLLMSFLLIRSRNQPLLACAAVIAFLGFLPVPIASGVHAASSRFDYLPNLYGAILAGLLLDRALGSKSLMLKSLGIFLVLSAIDARISIPRADFLVGTMISLFIPCICYVIWSSCPRAKHICLLAGIVSIAMALLPIVFQNVPMAPLGALIGTACAFLVKDELAAGALLGAGLVAGGPIIVTCVVLAAWVWPSKSLPESA